MFPFASYRDEQKENHAEKHTFTQTVQGELQQIFYKFSLHQKEGYRKKHTR